MKEKNLFPRFIIHMIKHHTSVRHCSKLFFLTDVFRLGLVNPPINLNPPLTHSIILRENDAIVIMGYRSTLHFVLTFINRI